MIKSVKVLYFSNNIIEIIKNNIIGLLLLFIPLIVVCYLIKEDNYKNKFKFNIKYIITLLILYVLPIISLFITNNNDIYSKSSLYFDINFPIKNLSSFGLITSLRLDTQRYIFKFKDKGSFININNEKYSSSEYNITNIDFKKSENEEIKEINEYFSNSIPSKKNIYSGLLKDKNLIFILAESFNYMAVKEDITPNLYRLFNDGFTFDNFYNPLFPVSTADGQYLTDISLFPSDAEHSLISTNKNYIPYSLASM
ncbi:MAG: hypothetical protein MR938_06190, partial [Tenericutes bacterium]|nr:hypothetical protein [Mycoplasmatota bacterium]